MKKNFKFYILAWALMLALFNLSAFMIPGASDRRGASFWIGYAFVSAAFLGQLLCAWLSIGRTDEKKSFYSISLFAASYVGVTVTLIAGAVCMAAPAVPYWLAAIICSFVFAINTIAVLKAEAAASIVTASDEKTERKTSFITELRSEAQTLVAAATTEELKAACLKVLDAFKYSDPVSAESLSPLEDDILKHFTAMSAAVRSGNAELAGVEQTALLSLISERNARCKAAK